VRTPRQDAVPQRTKKIAPMQTPHRSDRFSSTLWYVVAEGEKEHVLDSVRSYVGQCRGARSRPCISDEIRVLWTELYTAFGAVVRFYPEAKAAFDQALSLSTAVAKPSEAETVA
jgi:hypothetical protein